MFSAIAEGLVPAANCWNTILPIQTGQTKLFFLLREFPIVMVSLNCCWREEMLLDWVCTIFYDSEFSLSFFTCDSSISFSNCRLSCISSLNFSLISCLSLLCLFAKLSKFLFDLSFLLSIFHSPHLIRFSLILISSLFDHLLFYLIFYFINFSFADFGCVI